MRLPVFALLAALAAPLAMHAAKPTIAFVGLRHSHCWRQLENVKDRSAAIELVGIAESIPELVAEAKKIHPNQYYSDDYKMLVAERKPDIVWAFVENNRHLEILEYMAPLGIHVIFEKPLASNYAEAKKMQALAKKYGVEVMTNYQMAWWPTNQEIKRQSDSGAIGDVWRMHGIVGHGGPGSEGPRSKYFFAWLTDPVKNGAGALVDFGCYNAIWALWIKGRPQSVFAQVEHLQPQRFPKVEDSSLMVLDYPDGVGIFEGSWDLPHSFQDLELFGREGSLAMNRDAVTLRKGRRGEAETVKETPLPESRLDPLLYIA
ncbi:MAG: Gfo/Idh/MocA family oxidoreductase, partial [Acidobacteria bacterium]|nr:Gfo/Idh/MocA family oxidoreductase [Acidobacteriota bacterium]